MKHRYICQYGYVITTEPHRVGEHIPVIGVIKAIEGVVGLKTETAQKPEHPEPNRPGHSVKSVVRIPA